MGVVLWRPVCLLPVFNCVISASRSEDRRCACARRPLCRPPPARRERVTSLIAPLAALVVSLAAALGGLRVLQAWQTKRHEEFQELAARRGWSLTVTREVLGRPAVMRLQPRGGSGWVMESRRQRGGNGQTGQASAEFAARDPVWSGGTMVMGPPLSPEVAALTNMMSEGLSGPLGQKVMARLTGETDLRDAAPLRVQQGPAEVSVLATASLGNHFDLKALSRAYDTWQPAQTGERGWPVLIISREGFKLRLRHDLRRASVAERFIDLSLELARLSG